MNLVKTRTFGGGRRKKIWALKMGVERVDVKVNLQLKTTTLFSDITWWRELKGLSTDLNKKSANLFRYPELIIISL